MVNEKAHIRTIVQCLGESATLHELGEAHELRGRVPHSRIADKRLAIVLGTNLKIGVRNGAPLVNRSCYPLHRVAHNSITLLVCVESFYNPLSIRLRTTSRSLT